MQPMKGDPVLIPKKSACGACIQGLHEDCERRRMLFCDCRRVWHNTVISEEVEYERESE